MIVLIVDFSSTFFSFYSQFFDFCAKLLTYSQQSFEKSTIESKLLTFCQHLSFKPYSERNREQPTESGYESAGSR